MTVEIDGEDDGVTIEVDVARERVPVARAAPGTRDGHAELVLRVPAARPWSADDPNK